MDMSFLYQAIKMYVKLFIKRGSFRSFAQNGEDAVLAANVREIQKGFYVDVGAYHPTLYSNTYGLYRRGWQGLVIDPNIEQKRLFGLLRPRDKFIGAGIGKKNNSGTYHSFSDGAYNTFNSDEAEKRKLVPNLTYKGSTSVPVVSLAEILVRNKVSKIDVLNIDVEGMDLEVLESHDWKILPTIIAIESLTFNPDSSLSDPAYTFLRGKGYVLSGLASYTLIFTRA